MARPDRSELEALAEATERAIAAHLHARNMVMLEAVISCLLDVMDADGVAAVLREHADQIEAFG
jgi:hypothetical protein